MQTITTTQSIDIAELSQNLFSQIVSANASYLAISISIILGSGLLLSILMYLLNFKPMKESLEKQKEEIDVIKKETESRVDDLKKSHGEVCDSIKDLENKNEAILLNLKSVTAEEIAIIKKIFEEKHKEFDTRMKSEIELHIKEIDSKINSIEKEAARKALLLEEENRYLDINTTWNMHYVWSAQNVPTNALSSIVYTLEKTLESLKISKRNDYYIELCLKKLPETIDSVMGHDPKIFKSLPQTIDRLEACLSLVTGYEIERKQIATKIGILRNNLT